MMNTKKTKRADLERHRTSFFLIGMAVSLALIWTAFEYKSYDFNNQFNFTDNEKIVVEEQIPITHDVPEQPKPKVKVKVPIFEIASNDKDELPDIEVMTIDGFDDPVMEPEVWEPPVEKLEDEPPVQLWEIEKYPEFPGGEQAMMNYLASTIEYPELPKELGLQGTVYVGFVVEKDGSISSVSMLRGFNEECEAVSLKSIKNMPKWSPGEQRGKKVRVVYQLPVVFKLK